MGAKVGTLAVSDSSGDDQPAAGGCEGPPAASAACVLPGVAAGNVKSDIAITDETLRSVDRHAMMHQDLLEIPMHKWQVLAETLPNRDTLPVVKCFPPWFMFSMFSWFRAAPARRLPPLDEPSVKKWLDGVVLNDADVVLLPYVEGAHAALALLINPGGFPCLPSS